MQDPAGGGVPFEEEVQKGKREKRQKRKKKEERKGKIGGNRVKGMQKRPKLKQ
jgi:hypothetical protein